MLGTWSVVTYYCSLMALTVFYFIHSFYPVLPWTECDPAWADENCVASTDLGSGNVTLTNESVSSSEQFFK